MKSDRKLDEQIAQIIFYEKDSRDWCDICGYVATCSCRTGGYGPYPYSQEIKFAWDVVEKLRSKDFVFSLVTVLFAQTNRLQWLAKWEWHEDGEYRFCFSTEESAPLAICLVSLEALKERKI